MPSHDSDSNNDIGKYYYNHTKNEKCNAEIPYQKIRYLYNHTKPIHPPGQKKKKKSDPR